MIRQLFFVLFLLCCYAHVTLAQTKNSEPYPRVEVFVGYSANAYFTKEQVPNNISNFSPFFSDAGGGPLGFDVAVIGNVKRYLGLTADFSMYFDSPTGQGKFTVCQPGSCSTTTQRFNVDKRALYFMIGPEIRARNKTRFTPFGHTLFGVARSRAEFTTAGPAFSHSDSDTRSGFAMAFGGGLDIRLNTRFSLRTSLDYAGTFLGSADSDSSRQDHIRFSIGVKFH